MLKDHPVAATIPAADLARARAFYEQTLGLTASMEDPSGILYECGRGTAIFLYPSEFAGTGQQTIATWMASDLDAEVADLRNRGIVFEQYDMPGLKTDQNGIAELAPGIRGAWFKDPEGNILNVGTVPG
jgi:catechol 2,3-dioxygenase-like lactoylglutathione lyase family enzyme